MAEITKAQQARLDQIRDEWIALALSTDPADKDAAEAGIRRAYDIAKLAQPAEIIWFGSPLSGAKHLVKLDGSARWWQYIGGNLGAGWCSMIEAYRFLGVTGLEQADGIIQVARNAGPWWPLDEVCLVSDRPELIRLDAPRRNQTRPLHAEDGPAIRWRDGTALYAWHGIRVPARAIEDKASITPKQIQAERNAEVRRALVEIMGYERFISEAGGKKLHVDEYGTLWQIQVPGEDRPQKVIEVVNSTPEPDGTFKHYFLGCHDDDTTAHQAVARTFGMTAAEYRPIFES